MIVVIRCPGVQGEGGIPWFSYQLPFVWVSGTAAWAGVLAFGFDNGWIITLLEHMQAQFPSAAD